MCYLCSYPLSLYLLVPRLCSEMHVSTFYHHRYWYCSWWRHQMETFSALLALCAHRGQWRGELMFTSICGLNKRLSKQWWGWWFEMQSLSLWRHCTVGGSYYIVLTAYEVMYPYLIWHKPYLLTEATGYIQTRFLSTTLPCNLSFFKLIFFSNLLTHEF